MLISVMLLAIADPSPPRVEPAPLVINLLPPPCADANGEADVTVCAPTTPDFRIDPGVLAGQRALGPSAYDPGERKRSEAATAISCHDLPTKCQGSGVIPLLPAALKTIEAVALAAKGEDWREAFRTKPDEYQAYRAERRKSRVQVGVGLSAGAGSATRP